MVLEWQVIDHQWTLGGSFSRHARLVQVPYLWIFVLAECAIQLLGGCITDGKVWFNEYTSAREVYLNLPELRLWLWVHLELLEGWGLYLLYRSHWGGLHLLLAGFLLRWSSDTVYNRTQVEVIVHYGFASFRGHLGSRSHRLVSSHCPLLGQIGQLLRRWDPFCFQFFDISFWFEIIFLFMSLSL